MSRNDRESAVIVRVRLPSGLERLRRAGTPVAALGVPAHVTILYPFVPAGRLAAADRRRLAAIARDVEPFDVRFEEVGRFPGVIYLAPRPAEPFRALTAAVADRWPGHPPYEGTIAVDEVIPHLSIVEHDPTRETPPDRAHEISAATLAAWLPVTGRVQALEVVTEDGSGRWQRRWRIALGEPRIRP